MSNCCTPLYVKIPSVSPTGDIRLQRGTGNSPSCGYYDYYSGTPDLNNYDYHTVDIQYNSTGGFWTFSGNSTGFNDSSIYRSVNTGNPCNPVGEYTGGIFGSVRVNSDPFGEYPIYNFETSFENDPTDISIVGRGSGIHLERDVTFNFSFLDKKNSYIDNSDKMSRSPYFDGVAYDILNKRGIVVKSNYLSGYVSKFTFSEQDNEKIFNVYEPNFGVRVRTRDRSVNQEGIAEFYTYGNNLYIPELQVQDKQGLTKWYDSKTGSSTTGVVPSGKIEDALIIKALFANDNKNTKVSHMDIYGSQDSGFNPGSQNFLISKNIDPTASILNIEINKSFGVEPNKDYWYSIVGNSKIGSGNAVKFGPHKIYQLEEPPLPTDAQEVNISYKGSNSNNQFKTGNLNYEITGGSGVIDKLLINKEYYGDSSGIYDGPDFLFKTIPTDPSGKWIYTTFDYALEFKDPTDPYKNILKNIKLNATGTSLDVLNSGMPLFDLTDLNTGLPVEIAINYTESGLYVVSNTGHSYSNFKYQKNSF